MRILWPASCRAPRSHRRKPRRTSTRPGCGTWSRRCARSTARPPPGASAAPPNGCWPSCATTAPAARSSSTRHTAPSGGRSASRPGARSSPGLPRCAGAGFWAAPWPRRSVRRRLTTCRRASAASRRLLPQRTATTVVTEMGPADAERTVVLVAHHDAAHVRAHLPPGDPGAGLRPGPLAARAQRHEPAADGARGGDSRADRRRRADREPGARQGGNGARRGLGAPCSPTSARARRSRAPTTTPPAWRCWWRWRGRWRSARRRTFA